MTPRMRDALTEARRGPLRRVFDDTPGKPAWPAPAVTLHALVRHGLLEHARVRNRKGWPMDLWSITDAGRAALEPKERAALRDVPRFLAHPGRATGDYTTNPARAIDDLEVIDPDLVGQEWRWEAAQRHAAADDRKARARQLGRNMRRAA